MYKRCRIEDILEHSERVKTFYFDTKFNCYPGQFLMVCLPGVDEKPFSLSNVNSISVKQVGEFTRHLFKLDIGDMVWVRGPYGNNFPILRNKNVGLISGGIGQAPLFFLATRLVNCKIDFFIGAKTKNEVLFLDRLNNLGEVHVTTEDGSMGLKGIITDLLPINNKYIIMCGPEKMMYLCGKKLGQDPKKIFLSIERYMKCGIGLCGSCSCSGYRVCVDGPVFTWKQICEMDDFNKLRRDTYGRRIRSNNW
jgi:dihydroorotate dehydrogenase electron transfer subunit